MSKDTSMDSYKPIIKIPSIVIYKYQDINKANKYIFHLIRQFGK